MKKLFVLAIVAFAMTMIGCDTSKKKAFPLFSTDSANVESTTVTEKGGTTVDETTAEVTTAETTQETGTEVKTETTAEVKTETKTETAKEETTPAAETEKVADENKDTTSEEKFEYSTVKNLDFDLTIMADATTAVGKANINVSTNGEAVSASITDAAGKAAFKSTVSQTCAAIDIVIEHPEYETKTVTVDKVQDLATIARVIYLEKKKTADTVADADKDGVADDKDQFPDDPKYIAAVSSEYTIAFEDLYPNKGDADFNDLVVKFGIMEYIDPQNKISKINIRSKVLAAGAGYQNKFYISVLGKDYCLIEDPKKDLG
ncbi:MAG: LruC domain-containing protein [Spirochaetes bacterium]|nr:LruC domain-containing protein [Spirochaetota bacterium]